MNKKNQERINIIISKIIKDIQNSNKYSIKNAIDSSMENFSTKELNIDKKNYNKTELITEKQNLFISYRNKFKKSLLILKNNPSNKKNGIFKYLQKIALFSIVQIYILSQLFLIQSTNLTKQIKRNLPILKRCISRKKKQNNSIKKYLLLLFIYGMLFSNIIIYFTTKVATILLIILIAVVRFLIINLV